MRVDPVHGVDATSAARRRHAVALSRVPCQAVWAPGTIASCACTGHASAPQPDVTSAVGVGSPGLSLDPGILTCRISGMGGRLHHDERCGVQGGRAYLGASGLRALNADRYLVTSPTPSLGWCVRVCRSSTAAVVAVTSNPPAPATTKTIRAEVTLSARPPST